MPRSAAMGNEPHSISGTPWMSVPIGWTVVISLILFEDQRLLGAGLDALAGEFLIAWRHFVSLQDRIAGVVDRKEVRINRIALRMTHALAVVDANFHAITLPKLG